MNQQELAHPSPYRWWVLTMVGSVQFLVYGLSLMCMPALFYEMSQASGFPLNQLLFAWGMVSLAGLIANVPAGMLGDRFGTQWVSGLGLIACAALGAARALATDFPALMVVMFIYGISLSLATVNMPKTLGMWFPSEQLGLASGIMGAAYGVGSGLALLISGTVLSPALGGWQNVLHLWGGLTALLGILWLLTIKDRPEDRGVATKVEETGPSIFASLVSLFRKRQVLILCLINLLFMGGWMGFSGSIPFLLEEVRGWSAASAHGLISIALWIYVLGALVMPALSDRVGSRRPILGIGLVLSGVTGFLSILLATLFPPNWAIWVLMGISSLVSGGVSLISVIPLESPGVGPEVAGTAVGMIFTAASLGGFLFPFLNGLISGADPGLSAISAISFLSQIVGYTGAGLLVWWLDETGPKTREGSPRATPR